MAVDSKIVRKVLANIGDKLVMQLKRELKNQMHIATGKLRDGINYEIKTLGKNTVLRINAEGADYAAIVNDGVVEKIFENYKFLVRKPNKLFLKIFRKLNIFKKLQKSQKNFKN